MPSTSKFPSGLNNWAADDRPKREDFNADNEIMNQLYLDAARKPALHTEGNVAALDADGNVKDSEYPEIWLPLPTFLYAGRELPFTWAELATKVQAGDFSGIRVGDFKTVTLTTGEIVILEVAGMDTYYNYGDTAVGHHIDFISRDCLATTYTYNATATNSGGFVGSALKTTLNGTIYNTLPADLKAVMKQKRGFVETKTAATASGWTWQDLGYLWLPSEQEVWGQFIRSELYGSALAVQYPIFAGSLRHIVKGLGNGGARTHWWLLSSGAGSASDFCSVTSNGLPNSYSATTAFAVPLCFRIS